MQRGPGAKTSAVDQVGTLEEGRDGHLDTLGGQRSRPERVGTGELGKAIYITFDWVMAERPPGAPGLRSSQPGNPGRSGPEVVGCLKQTKRGWAPGDTMRAVCLMVTGLGPAAYQFPSLKAATCSGRPRLLEALLLEAGEICP